MFNRTTSPRSYTYAVYTDTLKNTSLRGAKRRGNLCSNLLLATLLLCTQIANAATQDDAISALRSGDYETALEQYRELQVDEPDNAEVLYGLGCVQYQRGISRRETGAMEEAQTAFEEARSAFGGVVGGSTVRLHADAAFNLANVLSQEAELLGEEDLKPKIKKWRDAVSAYEGMLETHPAHDGARHNLDFARYQLKRLLQQEQNGGEGGDEPKVRFINTPITDIENAKTKSDGNIAELILPKAKDRGGAAQ